MATFAKPMAQNVHMTFKPTSERPMWTYDCSGKVEAKEGPDPEETEELRSSDESGHSGMYMNQCLFVRTLPVKLRDDIWQRSGFDFGTPMAL